MPVTIDERVKDVLGQVEKLQEAVRELRRGGLGERALLVLLRDHTKIPMPKLARLLDDLETFEEYLRGDDEE